jgi:predicted secreted protein
MSKSRALGTQLKVNNKVVGGLTTINGIDITAEAVDLTSLDNTSGYREKEPGFKDAGEVGASGFMDGDDEGQDEIYDLLDSGQVVPCAIVFPAKIGKTWSFNAGVTKFTTGAELEGGVTFEISLAVSGKPTLGATPSQSGNS